MAERRVTIRDVGPRDGLQSEAVVEPAQRLRLAIELADAGVGHVEAASFVSPRAVPSMAGADEVFAGLPQRDSVRWWGLVPNRRGAELAVAAGVTALTITVSASAAYSQKNVGMTPLDALATLTEIADVAAAAGDVPLDTVISCSFGSPFDDVADAGAVAAIVEDIRATVPGTITLADTTGTATPRRIAAVLKAVGTDVGLHLHDTRGTALANALTAMDLGVRWFDTSVGGLGGSPFAPGAGGNLATEDLVLVLEDAGIDTGIDLDAILRISRGLEALVGHAVPSRVSSAGRIGMFGN
jgi:hydroxymethylglutaryl-CoA lyase